MKKNEGKIGVHREINTSIVVFEQEILMNVFYGLIKIFNNELDKNIIEISKSKLWQLMGYEDKDYCSEKIRYIIKQLTKSNTYEISENHKISGSVFVTRELDNSIQIEIPQTFRPYIFTKKDVGILSKVKKNKRLNVSELDYWDNTLKMKKKHLVLLKEADIFNLSGKYSKRLYTLLSQWRGSEKFYIKMDKFRKIMEVPKSYKMCDIDKRILDTAIKEIENKTDILNIQIEKFQKGRSIDSLFFTFEIKEKEKLKKVFIEKENKTDKKTYSDFENMDEADRLKHDIAKELMLDISNKNKLNLLTKLSDLNTLEELKEFKNFLSIE